MRPKYPFLFVSHVGENMEKTKHSKFLVVIASTFDYQKYDAAWMDDPIIGRNTLVPDVDLAESTHVFDKEEDALKFIKTWWWNNQ